MNDQKQEGGTKISKNLGFNIFWRLLIPIVVGIILYLLVENIFKKPSDPSIKKGTPTDTTSSCNKINNDNKIPINDKSPQSDSQNEPKIKEIRLFKLFVSVNPIYNQAEVYINDHAQSIGSVNKIIEYPEGDYKLTVKFKSNGRTIILYQKTLNFHSDKYINVVNNFNK